MGSVVFAADDGVTGRELWVSDGTDTWLAADINPGEAGSDPDSLTLVNGRVVFVATSADGGRELWSVDYQNAPVRLMDIYPGATSSNPIILKTVGNQLFFTANNATIGRELYVTDGTVAGTHLVKEIRPGTAAAAGITYVGSVGNHVVFLANDGTTGREMWASDGTAAGTVLLADINPGVGGVTVSFDQYTQTTYVRTREVDGKLQFFVGAGSAGMNWWETDGTAAGTHQVQPVDLSPVANRAYETLIGTKIYFVGNDGTGYAIWMANADRSGAVKLTDSQNTHPGYPAFGQAGDKVIFVGNDAVNGAQLWSTDGTAAGTGLLKIIGNQTFTTWITPPEPFGDDAVFLARLANGGTGLWISDGTTAGTKLLKQVNNWTASGIAVGEVDGRMVVRVITGGSGNGNWEALWSTDGTEGGTIQLAFYAQDTMGRNELPEDFQKVGDYYVYIAGNPTAGRELWATDGTLAGTKRLLDANPGPLDGTYADFRVIDGVLYFTTTTAATGTELWRTDGTSAGTRIVGDVNPAPDLSVGTLVGEEYTPFKDGALFHVQASDETWQLWFSDGTADGAIRLTSGDKMGWSAASAGDKAFFLADIGGRGSELWVTDGTVAGTHLTLELAPGSATGVADYPRIVNGRAIVSAAGKAQLWASDGTAEGTIKLIDAGSGSAAVASEYADRAFIMVTTGSGTQLWVTDGTTLGTHYLAAIPPNTYVWGTPDIVMQIGDGWLFAGLDAGGQQDLMFTDGTPAGTHLLTDINPGGSSTIGQIGAVGDRIFFVANDGDGADLWVTDGTSAGTVKLAPAGRLLDSGGARELSTVGDDRVLFLQGNDLWVSDGTVAGTTRVGGPFPSQSIYDTFFQDGHAYLVIRTSSGSTYDLWTTDGTANGTIRLVEGVFEHFSIYSRPAEGLAGDFVYAVNGPNSGFWATNGTVEGTRKLADATPVGHIVAVGDRVLFSGYRSIDVATYDYELWSVGNDGAVRIELAPGTRGSFPQELTVLNGVAYFIADAVGDRYELWRTDGTSAGTQRVANLNLGTAEDDAQFEIVAGKLVFMADDGINGFELWVSDGTAAGTTRVTNSVGPGNSDPGPAVELPTPPPPPTLNGSARTETLNGAGVGEILNGLGGNDTLNGNGGDDVLNGGDGNDQLFGGAGIDTLVGGAGNDRLDGGEGADVLRGGVGNDVYVVGAGDVIEELAGEGLDSVTASVSFTLSDNLENLTLTTIRPIDGFGNDLNNRITGTNYANRLEGGGGVDTLDGLNGNDVILGGSGGDIIQGGGGADRITGGTGNDTIRGGNGADVFLVLQESAGVNEIDTLNDFYVSQGDIIDLSAIDANALVDGDQAFTLVSAFSKTAGQMTLTWVAGQARTLLKLDVNGDGKADYQMKINGNVTGASGDWTL